MRQPEHKIKQENKHMADNPFEAPASATGISWDDHKAQLLYIEPLSVENNIKTAFGVTDAVRANVAVIDGDGAPVEYPDTLIFPKVLQGQVRAHIGKKVLGRLGQGEAKPGQSAPWKLAEATESDIETGKRWVAHLEKRDAERAAEPQVNTSSAGHVAKQEAATAAAPF